MTIGNLGIRQNKYTNLGEKLVAFLDDNGITMERRPSHNSFIFLLPTGHSVTVDGEALFYSNNPVEYLSYILDQTRNKK